MKKKGKKQKEDKFERNIYDALNYISIHPMFAPLYRYSYIKWDERHSWDRDGWAFVTDEGYISINSKQKGSREEWIYIIAHCLLHLGFEHFKKQEDKEDKRLWNIACDTYIAEFLKEMKVGRPPKSMNEPLIKKVIDESKLYERLLLKQDDVNHYTFYGTAGRYVKDMYKGNSGNYYLESRNITWQSLFAQGLSNSVASAVKAASGYDSFFGSSNSEITRAKKAQKWFINNYPLLGALAASFEIIESPEVCQRDQISVAAVNETLKEIYINPAAGLDEEEMKFVIAHELLHVGLRHSQRCLGRDFYFWNVACDYIINQWLMEMDIGSFPRMGGLYDDELKGLSAESIYDRIVTDLRKYRKLTTLRGQGIGDIIVQGTGKGIVNGMDLDEFYRSCLSQGLVYHQQNGRGYLPEGLIEEIKALGQPPIPWDVELAKWFDNYFQPIEKVRSYARPSRRQSSTPDIPRPRYIDEGGSDDGRTFGVVLDTSGSMDRTLLAMALGSIASYSISRDVFKVRVIFCDAAVYDQGYMPPEVIADRVKIKGRGGTILQPAVNLLEEAEDFPKDGPILIITDGYCDRIKIKRNHAFLIPAGNNLPFVPKGKVFRMKR